MRSFSVFEQLSLVYHFLTRYPAVKHFPSLDQETIRAYQLRRIQKLITIAYEHTSFYRQKYSAAGIKPSDIRSWEDFQQLPTVTKDEVIQHGIELVDRRRRDEHLFISRSSGSSGKFVTIYLDHQNFIEQELQVIRMLKEFYPRYSPLDLELLVYTSEYPVRSIGGFYNVHFVHNLLSPERIFTAMRRLRPAIVAAYPSILRELVTLYGSTCGTVGIKAIITNSEHASQEERNQFAASFGCPVFDEYSSEELSSIAQQCAHQHYHLVQDCSYIELLRPGSDQVVAPGEIGDLVGTCLINQVMPIIRYRQGDQAVMSAERCSCGRGTPIFAELSGRTNASFKRAAAPDIPSGRILDWSYALVLDHHLDIREYQIVQENLNRITVSIVPGMGYKHGTDGALIARSFVQTFGSDFDVAINLVPTIAKTSSGKHIPIRSLVHMSEPGSQTLMKRKDLLPAQPGNFHL